MNVNLKTHLLGMGTALYYYVLGVAIGWGGLPFIALLTVRTRSYDMVMAYYSIFATVAYGIMAYIGMHDIGVKDRRPYKWARYKAKGLVMGLMAFAVIYAVEAILIFVADKHFVVQHHTLDITGVHGYITQFIYIPFFWISKLLNLGGHIVPSYNYFTALIPMVFVVGFNGFAYMMGYSDKVIIKNKPKGKVAQFLFYGYRKKKKQGWQEKLNERYHDKDRKRELK